MAKKQLEFQLQKQICQYMNLQYRDVLYMSDSIAFCRLTIPQAVRNKSVQKDGFKCPDFIVFCPKGEYHGLFIELKASSPFKKDGSLYSSEHLQGQQKTITQLLNLGYYATFAHTFEQAKKIIDSYMNLTL